ncbi:hypothetical protein J3495_13895 [Flavobacterium sp. P7388]|uniref:Uncharacterized protein n=1 Tax=Flavobacterium geliluteum TaxID=2816120 RepID=A0A941B437_9FLAO|nr:hypothetical protein [Flavobacterium geliluteum]
MKRNLFNKIVGAVSIYYDIDLFQIIEAGEIVFYKIKITFINIKNENDNH